MVVQIDGVVCLDSKEIILTISILSTIIKYVSQKKMYCSDKGSRGSKLELYPAGTSGM